MDPSLADPPGFQPATLFESRAGSVESGFPSRRLRLWPTGSRASQARWAKGKWIVGLLLVLLTGSACIPRAVPIRSPLEVEGYLPGWRGARIHYRVLGSGPDTVVAVHGGPGAGMHSILPELQRLGDSRTIIFYDQRGGGRSELPADTTLLGARDHVQDLEAVRRFFGMERMALVAFSFGSVLVARYAEEYPDRVARLAFFGAVGPHRPAAAQQAQAALLGADSVTQARLRTVLRTLLEGSAPDPVAACRQYEALGREMALARGELVRWRGTTCAMPPDAVRYYYRYTARLSPQDFGVWDFRRSLRNFEFPLLVITGARDSVSLDLNRDWACAVRHGRLLIIPGAGKTASADRPDLFFPAVERFLAGRWPAGAVPCQDTGASPGVR